ncbi:MAG: MarR family transcriptional regulator [Oscillospiraceae bacterium]|nr:MarR family transcriptional regulator [Oscillospiraceae bacterium]
MKNFALDVKVLSDLIEKRANSTLADFGITISQARVLIYLMESHRQISLKELEKHFNVSQATMQGVIARMEKKGYLCTVYLPTNRKQKLVVLTEYGAQLADKMLKSIAAVNNSLADSLTEDEQKEFARLLKKVKDAL